MHQSAIAKPKPLKRPILFTELPSFRVDKGAILYQRFCSFCHGTSGKGNGPNSFNLSKKPFNFTDIEQLSQKTDLQLKTVIRGGGNVVGKSGEMPAFEKTLSLNQVEDVIIYLRQGFKH